MIEWWRRRRGRSRFCSCSSVLWPAKSTLLKLSSCLSRNHRAQGNANGLVVLYKDMESCGEYGDIRVLWEMVQSSRPLSSRTSRARTTKNYWKSCFRPNY